MRRAVAAAIPILLVSACSTQDVSYKTEINSYRVPDTYTTTTYLDKDYAKQLRDLDIRRLNMLIESHSSAFPPVDGLASRFILEDLQKIRDVVNTAIKYAENDLKEKEAGRLDFTYIKTDINGTKSSHERNLYCFDWDWLNSNKPHPIAHQLSEGARLNAFKSGDISVPNIFDVTVKWGSNEAKEIIELSRKLCKRYFSKHTGQLVMKGLIPYPIKKQEKN